MLSVFLIQSSNQPEITPNVYTPQSVLSSMGFRTWHGLSPKQLLLPSVDTKEVFIFLGEGKASDSGISESIKFSTVHKCKTLIFLIGTLMSKANSVETVK